MTAFFLLVAVLAFVEAIISLFHGFAFRSLLARSGSREPVQWLPPVTLIIPLRGLEEGLEKNLDAYTNLDYPDYQLILVTSDHSDPSVPVARSVLKACAKPCSLIFAGSAERCSQKVHNLKVAVQGAEKNTTILAFADSDSRPLSDWLQELVRPLRDPTVGASTGFRWYLPRSDFASRLRSAWNAGTVSLLNEDDAPFAWGGAMAVRQEIFLRCSILRQWKTALSDDYSLSHAIHRNKLRISFNPSALSFSYDTCSVKELLEWTRRQLLITRVYHPRLWWTALISLFINALALWGGSMWGLAGLLNGRAGIEEVVTLGLIGTTFILGVAKARLRLVSVLRLFELRVPDLDRHGWVDCLLGPVAVLVSLQALIRSFYSREVVWRGIRYRLQGPESTKIIGSLCRDD